ncbi:hypothetical protein G443_004238 [Actinoalloteichus cyanogriseus DSM 43889]|uniref:DUF5753 domain-containing protein n=1 Tax=Actinoalloteichus caeruleus DSM 43889 TaxID=1120930 RepID=A0ABT1JN61_ACTCY|nr:hypothetical protein [Actinoalloteichus caeruleus DSM 43889]
MLLTPDLVAAIAGALELAPADRESLVDQTRNLAAGSPWTPSSDLPGQLATLISYEQEAMRIADVATVIPGLLQTRAYARAVLASADGPYAPADLVITRMGRQSILNEPPAPDYTAYIDESALMRPVGGARVMTDQLTRLISHPTATVRIIPITLAPTPDLVPGSLGTFALIEFTDAPPVVYLEHLATGTYLDRPSDTGTYVRAVDTLSGVAMTPDESAKVIATYRDRYEGQDQRDTDAQGVEKIQP